MHRGLGQRQGMGMVMGSRSRSRSRSRSKGLNVVRQFGHVLGFNVMGSSTMVVMIRMDVVQVRLPVAVAVFGLPVVVDSAVLVAAVGVVAGVMRGLGVVVMMMGFGVVILVMVVGGAESVNVD